MATILPEMFFAALFAISVLMTVLFYFISLRKLSSTIRNYASFFTGIDLLVVSRFVGSPSIRCLCIGIGAFIAVFALVKIIRKMD